MAPVDPAPQKPWEPRGKNLANILASIWRFLGIQGLQMGCSLFPSTTNPKRCPKSVLRKLGPAFGCLLVSLDLKLGKGPYLESLGPHGELSGISNSS